jgi:transcriptional regulator with XRE-family HTH domain
MDPLTAALDRAKRRRSLPAPARRRLLREGAGLTQIDLARVIGVDRATVSRWESGEREPEEAHLDAYLEALDRLAREVM